MECTNDVYEINANILRSISNSKRQDVILIEKILNKVKEEAYNGNTSYIHYFNKDDIATDVDELIKILKEKGFSIELEKRKSNGSWYYYRMLIFW